MSSLGRSKTVPSHVVSDASLVKCKGLHLQAPLFGGAHRSEGLGPAPTWSVGPEDFVRQSGSRGPHSPCSCDPQHPALESLYRNLTSSTDIRRPVCFRAGFLCCCCFFLPPLYIHHCFNLPLKAGPFCPSILSFNSTQNSLFINEVPQTK